MKNQKAFGLLELIVTFAIVIVLTGGGWYAAGLARPAGLNGQGQQSPGSTGEGLSAEQQAQQLADRLAFPVPAPYGGYTWIATSSPSYNTIFSNSFATSSAPGYAASNIDGHMAGQLYQATNTDPAAIAWQKMDATAPKDQPEAFYGGDQALLAYYDQLLQAEGYQTQTLNLDQNFNPISGAAKPAYGLTPLSADGPHGTVRGYIKYSSGKIRAIIIASSDTQNQIFVSDVVAVKSFAIMSVPIPPLGIAGLPSMHR